MITKALLTIAMAGTLTNSAQGAFHTVSTAAANVANVYAAAGQMIDGTVSDAGRISAEAKMYEAAASLQGLADYAYRGEMPAL